MKLSGLDLQSFAMLDNAITQVCNRVTQVAGVCDLIAFAALPQLEGAMDLDNLSLHEAALMARKALQEVAIDLEGLLEKGNVESPPAG